jgi:peptidyl-prolyl cis-trans isomerase B (cyclophilin B)
MSRATLLAFAVLLGGVLTGCSSEPTATQPESTTPTTGTTSGETASTEPPKAEEPQAEEPKAEAPKPLADKPNNGDEVAVMETSKGRIVVMFYPDRAPETVKNFKTLAKDRFYDGTRFHRCIPGFMIQGGDPGSKDLKQAAAWGSGGPGYTINDELNGIQHKAGILSMAHAGPNTGGSQFFIMDGDAPHLDGVHTAFGKVVKGMDVVAKIIATGDAGNNGAVEPKNAVVLKSVKIAKWPQ